MRDEAEKTLTALAESMLTEEQRAQRDWDMMHIGTAIMRVTADGVDVLNPLEVVYGATESELATLRSPKI